MVKLSQSSKPLSKNQLKQDLDLSLMDFLNGLESLNRRNLLKTIGGETVVFDCFGLLREYIINLGIN